MSEPCLYFHATSASLRAVLRTWHSLVLGAIFPHQAYAYDLPASFRQKADVYSGAGGGGRWSSHLLTRTLSFVQKNTGLRIRVPECRAQNCHLWSGLEHLLQCPLNLVSLFAEWEMPLFLLHLPFREIRLIHAPIELSCLPPDSLRSWLCHLSASQGKAQHLVCSK